ncbi:hypothetical protein B296_00027311 [Ensete ventricosum]|uniref:Uncharacterized protein n=1 Tax=Ensete ventricosum TaxID=4639 RepID=A0A426YVV9_ENSVE|nr:hypothetical protein B296_00027311 [Ensete ventricosum]
MGLVGYRDYRRMDDQDRYDSVGMDDSMEDERDLDQIMADRRAAEMELDAREGRTGGIHDRKLPQMLYDQGVLKRHVSVADMDDDINFRRPKRFRADFRPPAGGRSEDDTEGSTQSSPGRFQRGHSRDDVPVTDQTDDDQYECSLEIDYKQFIYTEANIAIWLADAPQSVLEVMEEVAKNVVFDMHKNYKNIHQKIFVRITNLPVYDQIRNISYRKYMTFKKDFNELLLHLLRILVKDALHFEEIVSGTTARLMHIEFWLGQAQEYEIYDLKPFFSSAHFTSSNFILDESRGVIKHPLAR